MATISQTFGKLCKEKYVPLGFYKEKQTCARVSNDVLHTFTLKLSRYMPIATVEFGIIPLCMTLPFWIANRHFPIISTGNYPLDHFIVEVYAKNGGWLYDPHSEESIQNCVSSISQAIDEHLLPLFQKCTSCESALPELIRLDELFEENRLKVLPLIGGSDHAKHSWFERSLFDSNKYYMALKARDYGYAQKYLDFYVDYYEKRLQRKCADPQAEQTDVVWQNHIEKYRAFQEKAEILRSGNYAYFDKIIQDNERDIQELLKTHYPKLYK